MKFFVVAAMLTVASAQYLSSPLGYAQPLAYSRPLAAAPLLTRYAPAPVAVAHAPAARIDEYDPHPQYSYSYAISDALTGDNKEQHESRDGDVVSGSYSLVEPDGSRRIVDYTADPVNGFNAVVRKEANVAHAPVAVAAPAPILRTAPTISYAAATPLLRAAPAIGYASPAVSYASPAISYSSPIASTLIHH